MEGCRQTGDSGITKKSVLSEWHRRLGIQDSSQAQCLSHVSGDWVIYCRTMKRCCWLSFHFSTLRMSSRGARSPPRPWFTLPWESSGLAGNVSLNTGPPVTDYFSSLQCTLPVVILQCWYRSPASRGQNRHLHGKKTPLCLNLSMKTQNLSFHWSHSPLSACLTDLKIGNGDICTGE